MLTEPIKEQLGYLTLEPEVLMPNAKYLSGRHFEYLAKKELEHDGWVVLRASGSHGLYDLAAAYPDSPMTRWIQVKSTQDKWTAQHLGKDFSKHPPFIADPMRKQELWVRYAGAWIKTVVH